jgi:hypothetical protein
MTGGFRWQKITATSIAMTSKAPMPSDPSALPWRLSPNLMLTVFCTAGMATSNCFEASHSSHGHEISNAPAFEWTRVLSSFIIYNDFNKLFAVMAQGVSRQHGWIARILVGIGH